MRSYTSGLFFCPASFFFHKVKMAASIEGVLQADLRDKVNSCKVLVVGAGGIGCELLKNLVLTGFKHIKVVRFLF